MPKNFFPSLRIFLLVIFLSPQLTSLALAARGGIPGAPPPNTNQCKGGWTLQAGATDLAFGAFALESGTAILSISSAAQLTAPANVSLSAATPVSTFTATLNNTNTACGSDGFTINATAQDLSSAAGSPMPLNLVMTAIDSLGTTLVAGATAPQILTTANLPVSLIFHGDLTATFPQGAGAYTAPVSVDFTDTVGTSLIAGGTATATSLTPISLLETVMMNFGTVAGGSLPGTIIMDTLGARSSTGDAQIISTGPGNAGSFQITGEPALSYSLLVTGPAVLENAGGQQMNASGFTNNSAGTVPASGIEVFQIGATLNLQAGQAAGNYSTATGGGSAFTITVNYN
ncbi:MAG: DUF4402 domain-containing protein [Gammaproteobacteria bacterium]|nr:DUF4402 domain-containing protein [Gammaproteobacteria bacterium]